MRALGRWIGRGLGLLILLVGLFFAFAPREPVDMEIGFDPATLGTDLDAYLTAAEARFDDITPGTEKRIDWAGPMGQKTPLALVYLHGYSATARELSPVPEQVAEALGANLYFARLTGHGRGGEALAAARVGDWIEDTAEALEIGARLGDRVVVIATSTGATVATLAASHPDLAAKADAFVFVSPNYKVKAAAGAVLGFPMARQIVPLVGGAERSWQPQNDDHARYWTTRYPSHGLAALGALLRAAGQVDVAAMNQPVLAVFSDDDQVVDHRASRAVLADWGGPVRIVNPVLGPGDDPSAHVIAGDIISPGQTAPLVALITNWIKGL